MANSIAATARRAWRSAGAPGALGALAILALALAVARLESSWLGFNPQNGHFQNYNAMARLLAGQVPFVDFPSYLGMAALLVPFPAFVALGGDLAASNAAAALASVLALGASFAALLRLCGVPLRWALPLAAFLSVFPWPMAKASESALGLRSFLPFLAAALVHRLVRTGAAPSWRGFAALGAACGAMPLWSNDYGLTTALAAAAVGWVSLFPGWRRAPALAAGFAASAAASFAALATAATAGHPGAWLAFNFGAVARDQFWYFNPAAETKVFSLADLPTSAGALVPFAVAAALALRWLLLRRRDPAAAALATIAAATAGAVLVSGIAGSFEPRYFGALWRLAAVGAPFLAALGLRAAVRAARPRPEAGAPASHLARFAGDVAAVGLLCAGAAIFQQHAVGTLWPRAAADGVPVAELGGPVPASYGPAVDLGRRLRAEYDALALPPDRRLLSTYATLVSAVSGSRQDVPDYVIHGLGDEGRARFAAALVAGYRNVETVDPSLIMWGLWNVRMSWDFYRKLFVEWEPTARTPWSLVWSRRAAPLPPGEALACAARREGDRWVVTVSPGGTSAPTWADVRVSARGRVEPTGFPVVGSRGLVAATEGASGRGASPMEAPNFEWAMMGFVERSWTMPVPDGAMRFPVRVAPGAPARVELDPWPRGRGSLEVSGCSAAAVAPVAATELDWDGPRGGEVELASPAVPMAAPEANSPTGMAFFLRTRDGLAPARARAGDAVAFPGGPRSRVVARTFGWLIVEAPEGAAFEGPVDRVTVEPTGGR